jgi:hypothetical protein
MPDFYTTEKRTLGVVLRACNKTLSRPPQATPEGQCAALNFRIDDSGVMTRHCWDYNCARTDGPNVWHETRAV